MSRRFSDRPVTDSTPLTPDVMNSLIVPLDTAIAALEAVRFSWEEQITEFNTKGLKRISDALKPLLTQIQAAISGGLLAVTTDDHVALVEGEEVTFFVPPAGRTAFLPTPFLSITAPDVLADWAQARLITYDNITGLLRLEILHLNASGAARANWTISDNAGVVEVINQWHDAILAARTETLDARDEAMQAAEDTQAAAILIAGGPVSSVNGKTGGAITLVKADIGLGNVDNTSDLDKPVSTATATAIDSLADATVLALADKADKATTHTKTEAAIAARRIALKYSLIN